MTLVAVSQQEAADWLKENGHTAIVSPTVEDITVIYDHVLASHADAAEPVEVLLQVASELSYELGCVAWLVIVEGGDEPVLIYSLYDDGTLTDTYGARAGSPPEGGHPEPLADTFGAPKRAVKLVRAALNRETPHGTERHAKLVEALELPPLAVGASYATITAGVLPQGVANRDALVFVEPDSA